MDVIKVLKKTLAVGLVFSVFALNRAEATDITLGGFTSKRISGHNRYDTAFRATKEFFNNSDFVVIADGRNFADALSASNLVIAKNAPLLLSSGNNIDEIISEIERLGATKAYIVGGFSSVPASYDEAISYRQVDVQRIAGENRYETAKLSLEESGLTKDLVVASGESFADALAVGSYLSQKEKGLILSSGYDVDLSSIDYESIEIVGGRSQLPLENMEEVYRISGGNRYETSLELFKQTKHENKIIVDGRDYPDALVAVAIANKTGASIILSNGNDLENVVKDAIVEGEEVLIIGGEKSVPNVIEEKIRENFEERAKKIQDKIREDIIKDQARKKFDELINQHREDNGIASFSPKEEMKSYADVRAHELLQKFSHDRPNGTGALEELMTIMNSYGAMGGGENVVMSSFGPGVTGEEIAEKFFTLWKNSPGHNANMLRGEYTGYYFDLAKNEDTGAWYGVTLFVIMN